MSVRVEFIGRLGNNLFQYALGRIVAEHLGFELTCTTRRTVIPRMIGGQNLVVGESVTLEDSADYFPGSPLCIDGTSRHEPSEVYALEKDSPWRGHKIDLAGIFRNTDPRLILLRGWFQRMEYYAEHRDRIRKWFRPRAVELPYLIGPEDVLVNIRRGADYGLNGWSLPLSYYLDALGGMTEIGRIYVCGTCVDGAVRRALAKYAPVYCDIPPIEQFLLMMRFRRIVLSNSTFAWWAAYLSDAEQICAPRFKESSAYSFSGYGDVDLHMRESRYHEREVGEAASFGLFRKGSGVLAHTAGAGMVLVRQPDGTIKTLRTHSPERDFLEWLLSLERPATLADLRRQHQGTHLEETLDRYVRVGLLSFEPSYSDSLGNC